MDAIEMPRYRCHKQVWALKIKHITQTDRVSEFEGGSWIITPDAAGYAPFQVPHAFIDKHNPQAGGYYVVYEDGYKSYSPAAAFESGYTRVPTV